MSTQRQRDELIAGLATDLRPVRGPGRAWPMALAWLLVAAVITSGSLLVTGEIRPGVANQLVDYPRYLVEMLLGVAAVATLGLAAFQTGFPGDEARLTRRTRLALGLLAIWIATLLTGLVDPALEPSMLGKREYCWWETPLYALPAFVLGCVWLRGLYVLNYRWSAALLGLAAGSLPALAMQVACMYDPAHGLVRHLLPGLAVGLIGAFAGRIALQRR